MTSSNGKVPVADVIQAARAFNNAAIAALKVPSTLDTREVAERGAYFATMVIGPPSTAGQRLTALVERIVAGALSGEDIERYPIGKVVRPLCQRHSRSL